MVRLKCACMQWRNKLENLIAACILKVFFSRLTHIPVWCYRGYSGDCDDQEEVSKEGRLVMLQHKKVEISAVIAIILSKSSTFDWHHTDTSLYSSASIFHISLNNFHLSALADWKHCWKHFSALKNTLCASYRSIPSLIQVWYLPHSESANLKPDKTDKTLIPRENMSLPSNMQLNDLSTLKKGTFTTV